MSRIYFHAEEADAEVRGSERAHMGVTLGDLALAAASPLEHNEGWRRLLAPDSITPDWRAFRIGFSVGIPLVWGDRKIDSLCVALNTAIAIGNDPLILYARIHGQCEIHGYVEDEHRGWLAGVIEQGRECGLYRANAGWESVVALLRAGTGPVVTSYSVSDQFPNPDIAGVRWDAHDPERSTRDQEAWYDLTDRERWDSAIVGLRAASGGLEWKPDGWRDRLFDAPSMFDIVRSPEGPQNG